MRKSVSRMTLMKYQTPSVITKHPEWDYQSPFSTRYCRRSPLVKIFSEENRTKLWRELWCWLAQAQNELGIAQISQNQVNKLRENISNIDWTFIREEEIRLRHEVNAHIHAYECVCPDMVGLIQLGATSNYVQENADLILLKDALDHCLKHIAACLDKLEKFARKHKDLPTVGLTHYQPAALTTVGKRTCLWAQDMLIGHRGLKRVRADLRFHGVKGSTGSELSMVTLFGRDEEKVDRLNKRLAQLAGFGTGGPYTITGQTYPRMVEVEVLNNLAIMGAAVHKFCCDVRFLQSKGELKDVNPMRAERCCGFARYLLNLPGNTLATAALQGFERTLDDSANRRVIIPEAFLTLEAMIQTVQTLIDGLAVEETQIELHITQELPFLVLEPLQIELTLHGDKKTAETRIRKLAEQIQLRKDKGRKIELVKMLEKDKLFDPVREQLKELMENPTATLTGRCSAQVEKFLTTELKPAIEEYNEFIEGFTSINGHTKPSDTYSIKPET